MPKITKNTATVVEEMGSSCETGCSSRKKCSGVSSLALVLIICTAAQIATSIFLATMPKFKAEEGNLAADQISNTLREIQYAQAGGKEIYDLYMEVQKLQGQKNKSQLLEQIKTLGGTVPANNEPSGEAPVTSLQEITAESIAAIRKDAFIEGNQNAKITLVEYSDLECPYCIMQYKNGVIGKMKEKYGDKINVIFKPLNLARHPWADQKGMASICVGKIAGAEKYTKFYHAILEGSDERGAAYPLDKLASLAADLKVDAKKFKTCYDTKETEAIYKSYTDEAMKNMVKGTPSTLIFNNETKKFEIVEGAAPAGNFESAIEKLLK